MLNKIYPEIPRHILGEADLAFRDALRCLYSEQPVTGVFSKDSALALFRRAGRAGLLDHGSNLVRALVASEVHCSATEPNTTPLVSNFQVLDAVARLGTAKQQSTWMAPLASGELISALALIEPGAAVEMVAMNATARATSEGYVLNGTKIALSGADLAQVILVVAKIADVFVVGLLDAEVMGIQLRPFAEYGLAATVTLTDVPIGIERVLGGGPITAEACDRLLRPMELEQSARAVARLERVFGLAVQAAKADAIGRRPIFKSQAIQFKLADLYAELMVTRAYMDDSIARAVRGEFQPVEAAMLKLWIGESEERILTEVEQVVGALSYSTEYPIAKLHALAKVERLAAGPQEEFRRRIFHCGVRHDSPDSFDILTVGRDRSVLTEEYELYRQSLRRFLQSEIEPFCHSWIASGNIPKNIWKKAAAAGLLGVRIPAEEGGGGGDALHYVICSEEVGRSRAGPIVGPLFQSDTIADLIIDFGTLQQKEIWYPRFLAGDVPAFAVTEPQGGSDVRAFRTRAVRDGDTYVINGSKVFISFATHADFFFILAKTDPQDPMHMSFFVVDAKTPGIEPRRLKTRMYPCGDTCEVFLTDVRVSTDSLVGEIGGKALAQTKQMLGLDRVQTGARSAGSADLSYRLALDFVATRVVFGKNLIEFENTQSVLAQVRAELHAARAFIDYAFQRHARGTLDFATASVAKLWHPTFEQRTADRLMQLFGGNGFVSDYTIAHQLASARANRVLGGTDEMQRQAISYAL